MLHQSHGAAVSSSAPVSEYQALNLGINVHVTAVNLHHELLMLVLEMERLLNGSGECETNAKISEMCQN